MPSFKLWFLSAVLFAILFPRSTVFAEEVPAPPTVSFTDETVRTWKDTSGEFTTQAVLVGVQKDMVSLRIKDDRTIQVPLSKLSKADQAYVQSKLKKALSKPTPKPAVVADEAVVKVQDPTAKWIVGSWKMVFSLDPKKLKAELAKVGRASAKGLNEDYLDYQKSEGFYEFREDGTFTMKFILFDSGEPLRDELTWKLVVNGEKELVLEVTPKGEKELVLQVTPKGEEKVAYSLTWISKDQFTLLIPPAWEVPPFITGLHFQRIKDAPKP